MSNFIPFDFTKRTKAQIKAAYGNNFKSMLFIGPDNAHLYRLGAGITSATPSNADTMTTYSYLIDQGGAENDQTQKAVSYALAGNRNFGDPAQEFVADQDSIMNAQAYFIVILEDGSQIEGIGNLSNIIDHGGDMNARNTFSFTFTFDGIPFRFSPEHYDMSKQGGTYTDVTKTGVIQDTYTRTDPNVSSH